MGDFPIKKLQLDQEDFSKVIEDVVKKFTARVNKQNARLATGYLDAPCMEEAISLGGENGLIDTQTQETIYAYKVNIPGYFYRQHYDGNWNSKGVGGVLVSDRPSGLSDRSSRMVYLAGSDSTIGHANAMFPILPGSKTYVYIVRNGSLTRAQNIREWLFVPTVLSASLNIHPDSYVSKVGIPSNRNIDLSGLLNPVTAAGAFTGDWKTNFKSVCGWNVADEAKMDFLDPYRDIFVQERKTWITGLGAKLSDHGY